MSNLPLPADRLRELATQFRLPTVGAQVATRFNAAGHADALETLLEVFEMEAHDRMERRVERLRKAARLPPGKTFSTLDLRRLPKVLTQKLKELKKGRFADEASNVLAFGLPGVGKSHAMAALGHELIQQGRTVLFSPTFRLVQELLAAKRDLKLPRALQRLDDFDVLILDDIGYVQQSPEEVEVLFTLMSERYERRSMVITSNLVFSQWDQIFKNPMTTAAAIDRVVHHAVILEFNVPSYRNEEASRRGQTTDPDLQVPSDDQADDGTH